MKKIAETTKTNGIYSPKSVAEALEVRESFVKRLLRDGQLKGFRLGKFWRITEESLDEYCARCGKNGNGHHGASETVRNKMKFHANLRSGDILPGTMERLTQEISKLKGSLQAETGHKKVAMIAKLQMAVTVREDLRKRLEGLDSELTELGAKAYPDLADLVDTSPDALEEIFVLSAKEPKKSILDFLDKKALEEVGRKKVEGAEQGEQPGQAAA